MGKLVSGMDGQRKVTTRVLGKLFNLLGYVTSFDGIIMWVMNMKGSARKPLWPILRHWSNIFLMQLRKTPRNFIQYSKSLAEIRTQAYSGRVTSYGDRFPVIFGRDL